MCLCSDLVNANFCCGVMVDESLSQVYYLENTVGSKAYYHTVPGPKNSPWLNRLPGDISEMAQQLCNSRSVGSQPVPQNWTIISIKFL